MNTPLISSRPRGVTVSRFAVDLCLRFVDPKLEQQFLRWRVVESVSSVAPATHTGI